MKHDLMLIFMDFVPFLEYPFEFHSLNILFEFLNWNIPFFGISHLISLLGISLWIPLLKYPFVPFLEYPICFPFLEYPVEFPYWNIPLNSLIEISLCSLFGISHLISLEFPCWNIPRRVSARRAYVLLDQFYIGCSNMTIISTN